jgi:hypothetical protein
MCFVSTSKFPSQQPYWGTGQVDNMMSATKNVLEEILHGLQNHVIWLDGEPQAALERGAWSKDDISDCRTLGNV